jgi:hypothetical protein
MRIDSRGRQSFVSHAWFSHGRVQAVRMASIAATSDTAPSDVYYRLHIETAAIGRKLWSRGNRMVYSGIKNIGDGMAFLLRDPRRFCFNGHPPKARASI